ncbi:double-strand-break repair protein rad21 homolog isoform X2 [Ctenocephalides felis]|uniref:double-strand-break repair protein rad21 homolog isoform X2 n=1 Tax=Ctenocephalides felis TaxID=7515 RepID=UPI000E6E176A|nr:double-strand-break repair protein rad21 homolog isoform X2 [Ctenocephalides felis]
MFYAHFVLSKKGPLARIWLAAHWDKKLTKAHVFETNIESSVDGILQPKVKMALRTTGHLLLGVVRIYSRKAKYLLADCNEAFVKIKMAFRPGMVDLPEEHREAAMNAITLPEVFHDFNTAMTDLNDIDLEAQFSLNQTRAEDITLREDYGSLQLVPPEDGFGDMVFDSESPDIMREALSTDQSLEQSNLLFTDGVNIGGDMDRTKEPLPSTSRSIQEPSIDTQTHENAFGNSMTEEFGHAGGLFEGDLFSDVAPEPVPLSTSLDVPPASSVRADSDDDMDHFDGGAPSPVHSSDDSRPASPILPTGAGRATPLAPSPQLMPPPSVPSSEMHEQHMDDGNILPPEADQTTLLQNEEESFALAPIDASALKGVTKAKRKRKLIVDEVKNISGEEMKNQLSDTTDIVTTLDLAPPTKRLMHWKETGGVEKLFALPSRHIPARTLFKNYQRHLTSRSFENEEFANLGPDLLPEQPNPVEDPANAADSSVAKRLTRKRKLLGETEAEPSKTPYHEPDMSEPVLSPMTSAGIHDAQEAQDAHDGHDAQENYDVGDVLNQPVTPGQPLIEPPTPSMIPMTPGTELLGDLTHGLPMTPCIQPTGMSPTAMTPDVMRSTPMTPSHLQPSISPTHMDATRLTSAPLEQSSMTSINADLSNTMVAGLPQIPGDQVSSILDGPRDHSEFFGEAHSDALQVPSFGFNENQSMQMANMGYDELAGGNQTPRPPMSERVATPWHEDFDFPPSVGLTGEEQMVDETDEQFEERVLNKRAAQLFMSVKTKFYKQDHLFISDMARNNNRKQAAQKFYSLLVLKKFQVLDISQEVPCGDIRVVKGVKFDNPTL